MCALHVDQDTIYKQTSNPKQSNYVMLIGGKSGVQKRQKTSYLVMSRPCLGSLQWLPVAFRAMVRSLKEVTCFISILISPPSSLAPTSLALR